MLTEISFTKIGFDPDAKELYIENGTNADGEPIYVAGSPFDLSAKGVKINVTSPTTLSCLVVEKNGKPAFSTEGFELKLDFKGDDDNANMNFGMLTTNLGNNPISALALSTQNKFHLLWIGSDDIRVNHTEPPKGILLMEEEVLSFEILDTDKYLVIRYHESIQP